MTTYWQAELVKGRIEVGNRVHVTLTSGPDKGTEHHGDVCETRHAGKEHPCAVLKVRGGALVLIQLANVAPGARQKRNA